MTEQLPDVEGAMRTYLRADSTISGSYGGRVFFGAPDSPEYPMVLVSRVGGAEDASDAPLDVALLQIDCIGKRREEGGGKISATQLWLAVKSALRSIQGLTQVGTDRLFGASVVSDVYLNDPVDGRPRYVLTVQVSALAAV